jgi:hypothetical protein
MACVRRSDDRLLRQMDHLGLDSRQGGLCLGQLVLCCFDPTQLFGMVGAPIDE